MNRARAAYFLFYAAAACLTPFLTLYYESLGLSGPQIGVLAGLVPLMTLVSAPLWGGISDATGRHRLSLIAAIGGTWLAALLMSRLASFAGLLPAVAVYAFFLAPIVPLVDNSVLDMLGTERNQYGRIRLWGGIGWAVAALAIGPVLQRAGLTWTFYGYLFFLALMLVVSLGLPVHGLRQTGSAFARGLGQLLQNRQFVVLLVASLCFGASLSVMLNFQFLFLAELGASATLMSLSLAVATITELPFWFISDRLFARLGRNRMIAMALGVMAVRLQLYALMPAAWWILPISLLHGPTFAVMWAAGVADADVAAPPGLGATAQGMFSGAMLGLGAGLGAILGGIIYDALGPRMLFQLAALLLLAALIGFILARNALSASECRATAVK